MAASSFCSSNVTLMLFGRAMPWPFVFGTQVKLRALQVGFAQRCAVHDDLDVREGLGKSGANAGQPQESLWARIGTHAHVGERSPELPCPASSEVLGRCAKERNRGPRLTTALECVPRLPYQEIADGHQVVVRETVTDVQQRARRARGTEP